MKTDDTIFALATGTSRAAIAVARLSGAETRLIVERLAGQVPPPRLATFVTLVDPESGEPIDKGLVLFFPGPRSFTGEDYAEFHVHGSRAVLTALLAAIGRFAETRPADPGEFTRRALLNGKMDPTQVEGLADLIDAETRLQRRQALRQMEGALGERVAVWRRALLEAAALVAAEIDFSDEADVPLETSRRIGDSLAPVLAEIEAELAHARVGELIRDGLTIVIAGPPNAGKSTLLNALARRDVAIVSAEPGTTRDMIEVHLDLRGCAVCLVDTAGLRESASEAETIGVARAKERAKAAQLVLWLSEASAPLDPPADLSGGAVRRIFTKADLGTGTSRERKPEGLWISAQTGENLDLLVERLAQFAASETSDGAGGLITRERHRKALAVAARALKQVLGNPVAPVELLAEDLRVVLQSLQKLIGLVDVEDILGEIFARFCIGK